MTAPDCIEAIKQAVATERRRTVELRAAADATNRSLLDVINKLMGAEKDTPEGKMLDRLTDIVVAYESARWPMPNSALERGDHAWGGMEQAK